MWPPRTDRVRRLASVRTLQAASLELPVRARQHGSSPTASRGRSALRAARSASHGRATSARRRHEPGNGTVRVWSSRDRARRTRSIPSSPHRRPARCSPASPSPTSSTSRSRRPTRAVGSSRSGCSSTACRTATGSSTRPARPARCRTRRSCRARWPSSRRWSSTRASSPNGPHSVRVTVTDVAGNVTQSDPYTVVARNGGQPNGANASRTAKLEAWFKSNRAHRTSATVAVPAAADDRGAADGAGRAADRRRRARPHRQAMRPASATRTIGTVVTDRNGRFKVQAPRGSSREIRIGYRAYTLDDAPAATATLNLNVKAALSLDRLAQAGAQRQRRDVPWAAPRRAWAVRDAGDDLCRSAAGARSRWRPCRPIVAGAIATATGSGRSQGRRASASEPSSRPAELSVRARRVGTVSVRARP